jgi:type IV pilus biogenesis protein CpaD/CtpE
MTASLSIYENAVLGTGPARPPRGNVVMPRTAVRIPQRASMQSVIEQELTRILDMPMAAGESVQRAFDVKESQVLALFESLSSAECTNLHLTITNGKPSVASFSKLTAERRGRLIAHLINPNRRRAR